MINQKKINSANDNKRFYPYIDFRDKIFLVFAKPISLLFFKIGINGNTVSLFSGLFALCGGILLASNNKLIMLSGSACFLLFYLLDYVDGMVARYRDEQSIGGQYLDLIMHLIVSISFSLGISIGSINNDGALIIPFAFLTVIASGLTLSRFSIGWMSIIMKLNENKISTQLNQSNKNISKIKKTRKFIHKILIRLGSLIFHEDYFIFTLPIILFFNLFLGSKLNIDIRSIIIIFGGVIYFPAIILDVIFYTNNRIDLYYYKTFESSNLPDMPKCIYFD